MRTPFQLWYGRNEPPVETRTLRAGPVTARLEGRDLRYVRIGGVEVVRRLYAAVRDENWGTVPGEPENRVVEDAEDRFRVRFDVRHRQQEIDFSWRGEITGSPDGTITYTLDGVAASDFRYNRIGFCVLHPPRESAGRPYRGETPEGPIQGTLPLEIGPQRIEGGKIYPLFPSVQSLTIDLAGGVTARFDFEGDLFEMEDQRNWTDDSFKTYSTPLALGFPKEARKGQRFHQRVTLSLTGAPEVAAAGDGAVRLTLGSPTGRGLPALGLGMASHGGTLSAREVELLRRLRLDHLRVDLHLRDPAYPRELERAAAACEALGCAMELAVFVTADAVAELSGLAMRLNTGLHRSSRGGNGGRAGRREPARVPIARVLVFHEGEASTAGRWVLLARKRLEPVAPGAAFAGGTNVYFTDLNRNRPEVGAMDAVAYSINPQVHAFDEASLVETMAAQAATVASACAFCGDRPLVVSPVTLRPRFNPNATGPEPEPAPGELPSPVDPRQTSLFGAGWTLGSVKYLAESGAASVTYYETSGWRGVLETEAGSSLPERFPAEAGDVFPLYHVFADLAEWKPGEMLVCQSSDPLVVEGLALRSGGTQHLLVANMRPTPQRATIGPLAAGRVSIRVLDAASAPAAIADPERFRASAETAAVTEGRLAIELAPYAVARIDLKE
jgi:hypothetical protein